MATAGELNLRVVSTNESRFLAPNNWFVFNEDGTMVGPRGKDQANSLHSHLASLDKLAKFEEWYSKCYLIPEELFNVFEETFGHPIPNNKKWERQ